MYEYNFSLLVKIPLLYFGYSSVGVYCPTAVTDCSMRHCRALVYSRHLRVLNCLICIMKRKLQIYIVYRYTSLYIIVQIYCTSLCRNQSPINHSYIKELGANVLKVSDSVILYSIQQTGQKNLS